MRRRPISTRVVIFAVIIIVAKATPVSPHDGRPPGPNDLWSAWNFEPFVLIGLALSAWLYWRGARRMANRSLRGRASLAFLGGWLASLVALASPLDSLGAALFSARMTQHEILMLIAAPLLVLGRPVAPFLLALPARWRRYLAGMWKTGLARRGWRFLVNPFIAWLIHAAVLWLWHAPALFQATLESEFVHAAQRLSFLASALVFCEALIERRGGYGAAVIYVFTTAIHTSALGALMTFSQTLWCPACWETTSAWGLTPMEDQQLGGLIMWVPASVIYLAAGLALFELWLREAELRALRREAAPERTSGASAS